MTYDATSNPLGSTISGKVDLGTATRTFAVADSSSTTSDLTVSAVISNASGTAGVTKTGAGTLVLSGANAYNGGTGINGGIVQVNSAGALGSTGTISFGGGTLQYTSNNTTDYSSRISTAASQAVSVDTNGQNVTFATGLTSSGGTLTKIGAGTLTLSGASSYTGTTTVSAGGLQVGDGATGSLTGSGAVTVSGGSTLGTAAVLSGGTGATNGGVINGATSIGTDASQLGILAPGVGTAANQALSFASDLTINTGSQIQLRITHATANLADINGGDYNTLQGALQGGTYDPITNNVLHILGTNLNADSLALNPLQTLTKHDLVNVGGALNVTAGASNSAFKLVDNGYLSGTVAVGDMFKLVDWGSLNVGGTGTLTAADFNLPTLGYGYTFDTSAFQTYGVIVVVPEPSRMLLLMFGLLGLFFNRRRRYSV